MEHSTDKIWSQIVIEAESAIHGEPNLKNFLNEKILSHESMKTALSCSITEITKSNLPKNYVCSRTFKEIMNQSLCEKKIAQDHRPYAPITLDSQKRVNARIKLMLNNCIALNPNDYEDCYADLFGAEYFWS